MKETKKNMGEFTEKFVAELKKEFGPIEELKKQYTETERRVIEKSYRFKGMPETVENAQIALDILNERLEDIMDLEHYMASGDWQKDYEADERGEIRKDIPRGVLSQDELYNTLMELHGILKDMRRLVRHYKTPRKEKKEE